MSFTHELQLGAFIAQGHFGDVHEGQDPIHGRVAIKVLRPYPGEAPSDWRLRKETLLSEAQNLKAAEHPNIVRIYTLVRASLDDRLHMVVEFCEKGSLNSQYQRGPALLSDVRAILTDACAGLGSIHYRGMIHRDIKPGNLLATGNRYKIGDFGLVSNNLIAGYASAQGYVDHLAPEFFFRGLTSVQTDIWALGMTIYRLLHGQDFYDYNFGNVDIRSSIINGSFASKLPWLAHVPSGWRKFVRRAMHDDTSLRFRSAHDMCQAAASLPVSPDWQCNYHPNRTTWNRQRGERNIAVEWTANTPRHHYWNAMSHGGIRSLSLGGSSIPLSRAAVTKELEAFFSKSTK